MAGPAPVSASRRGRSHPPPWLAGAGVVIGVAMALPVAYLVVVVAGALGESADTIWRERTLWLVLRSVGLAAAVTAGSLALAIPLAWLTTRTDLPLRRTLAVLTMLPLVIPSYIGAYLVVSALGPRGLLQQALEGPLGVDRLPSIYGFPGALLTLVLFTYPLALLTIRGALRRLDPLLEEAARGMGRSGPSVFRGVVLPQLAPAIGAGALLVALYVLHDFGAVSILRFDSFTRTIYTAYSSGSRTSAAALATLLVLVMLAVLWAEGRARRRTGALHRSGPGTARPAPPMSLGRWRWPAFAFCAAVVALALVLPVTVLGYWSLQSVAGAPDWGAIAAGAGNSLVAAGLAAGAAAALAIPVALLSARHASALSATVERASHAGYALPGIVVALALVFFGTRVAEPLYGSLALLVFAWVVLFLPQAIGSTRAALLQVSPRVEEAARSMGRGPFAVVRTVTAPLAAAGVTAGAALVFLTAVKELPAALILAPIEFDTLATEIWRATSVGFFERGAVPSLVLLALSAVPLYLLTARGE